MAESNNIELSLMSVSNFILHKTSDIKKNIYPKNLSSSYGYIISYLCDNEDADVYQRDIEKAFDLNRSTVSNILKELEKEGLIERSAVAGDARLKKVSATQGARMINDACNKEIDSFLHTLAQGISTQDMESFSKVLELLKNNAENMNEKKCAK